MNSEFKVETKTELPESGEMKTEMKKSSEKTNEKSTEKSSEKQATTDNSMIKYIVFGLLIVVLISVIVFISIKTYKTQLNNLGALLETSRKEEALLHNKLKTAEQDKQMYIQKINQLNNDIQTQYTPILPMTVNSYDAPDPDAKKEKPKLLKDKEAIKAYVNTKRQTVQDELDEREAQQKQKDETMINSTENEIQAYSNADKRDEKVDEIMEIIQAQ